MDDVDGWLRAWSRFEEILSEAGALASVAYTCDTTDPVKEAAHLRFTKDIGPRALEQRVRLGRRLLATGHSAPDLDMILRRMRNQEELFRKTNVPLLGELQELSSAWQKLAAGLSATWAGPCRFRRCVFTRPAPIVRYGSAPTSFTWGPSPASETRSRTSSTVSTSCDRPSRTMPASPTTATTPTLKRTASTTRREIASGS